MIECLWRRCMAEFLGTGWLVFAAVGTAVFGLSFGEFTTEIPATMGPLGVSLAFGFVLISLVYAFGPVSGCHVNPAVTVGMLIARRIKGLDGGMYIIAQFAGGILGGGLIYAVALGQPDYDIEQDGLGNNGFGDNSPDNYRAASAFGVETIMTFFFVLVVLMSTDKVAVKSLAGVAIGSALAVAHLVAIPIDNASINPARSFGVAVYRGGWALDQVYMFLLAPTLGGCFAGLCDLFDLFGTKSVDDDEHSSPPEEHRESGAEMDEAVPSGSAGTRRRSTPRARASPLMSPKGGSDRED